MQPMILRVLPCIAAFAFASPALALELALPADAERSTFTYQCSDDTQLTVEYVNAGANSLALMELDGEPLLFVNVVSGSGARYVTGAQTWWTSGAEATLENEFAPEGTEPLACEEAGS